MTITDILKLVNSNKITTTIIFIFLIFLFLLIDNLRPKQYFINVEIKYKIYSDFFLKLQDLYSDIQIYDNIKINNDLVSLPFDSLLEEVSSLDFVNIISACMQEDRFIDLNGNDYNEIYKVSQFAPESYLQYILVKFNFTTNNNISSKEIFSNKIYTCHEESLKILIFKLNNVLKRFSQNINFYDNFFNITKNEFTKNQFIENDLQAKKIYIETFYLHKIINSLKDFTDIKEKMSHLENIYNNNDDKIFFNIDYNERDIKIHETTYFLYFLLSVILSILFLIVLNYKKI